MHTFLEDFNCLYELQFGFRAKHSTNHALIDITENVKYALDNNIYANIQHICKPTKCL